MRNYPKAALRKSGLGRAGLPILPSKPHGVEELLQSSKVNRSDFTFPDRENAPAERPQFLNASEVSFPVPFDLLLPVLPIGLRDT